ncbi:response regulator [Consotaella salsifontis]|uniref:Two-component system, chemotaxis family, response regulator CheY n=1 Tax=Consotaella salsifontis TaxID=1365950 RepID=A0A1T4SUD6_9HYPH|nr:response regulator [Consotaella salsifontis]SKA31521.1 two-component system, chemotaxis family, response regulator CheY [Consotaella salsifontis]
MTNALPTPSAAEAGARRFTWPGTRVLVVDDAITIRLFCRQILEKAGFEVIEAINGLEGLEQLLQGTIDLIVVDVNMQKMDGYEMLREVRRQPVLSAIPAVMMSTKSKPEDVDKAYAAGANYYLFKPIRPEPFLACVRLLTATVQ